jgi:hypothetical protein
MDRTTKFLLAVIAVALWLDFLAPMFRPAPVKASGNMSCTGAIKVNAFGATATSIGGYNVNLQCTE